MAEIIPDPKILAQLPSWYRDFDVVIEKARERNKNERGIRGTPEKGTCR